MITSTLYLLVRLPTKNRVKEMCEDQQLAQHYLTIATKVYKVNESLIAKQLDQRETKKWGEPAEQLIFLLLKDEDPSRVVQVGTLLLEEERNQLLGFLQSNANIFAYSASDMLGIPLEVVTHKLNVDPKYKPI